MVDCYDALTSDRPYRPALSDSDALAIIVERRGTMYDPRVVDTFLTVCSRIAAVAVAPVPHQEALAQIGRATTAAPPMASTPQLPGAEDPGDVLAIVSLARVFSGVATLHDAAGLATAHLARLMPETTGVFYVSDPASGRLVARHSFGPHAAVVRGTSIAMGERLTGWVAACRQPIVNSPAALDLFDRGVTLGNALGTPLVHRDRVVGVLTVYAAAGQAFTEEQSRLVQMMTPHLGLIVGAALRGGPRHAGDSLEPRAAVRELRVVSRT